MGVTASGACQGCQTAAKPLRCLTLYTFTESKTHEVLETIIMLNQKRTQTGGKQTIVPQSSKSNDFATHTKKVSTMRACQFLIYPKLI